jgi:hypothetical protein
MAKFNVGDIVQADRSGSIAEIVFIDLYLGSYLVKFKDTNFGTQSYSIETFDPHWSLIPIQKKFTVNGKVCTCGTWKCYGVKIQLSFHSDYCELKN